MTRTTFGGLPIAVVRPRLVSRRRTWRERLFSRPWRPGQLEVSEPVEIIDPDAAFICDGTLFMGERAFEVLKKAMEGTTRRRILSPTPDEPKTVVVAGITIENIMRAMDQVRGLSPSLSPFLSPTLSPFGGPRWGGP